mmetsp:Transcript_26293/g.71029  ORF Transcript_26293/g.71029 Transcript_26293/m.71029 type:complete len:393 (+) Transcript_26293:93-1271(+)
MSQDDRVRDLLAENQELRLQIEDMRALALESAGRAGRALSTLTKPTSTAPSYTLGARWASSLLAGRGAEDAGVAGVPESAKVAQAVEAARSLDAARRVEVVALRNELREAERREVQLESDLRAMRSAKRRAEQCPPEGVDYGVAPPTPPPPWNGDGGSPQGLAGSGLLSFCVSSRRAAKDDDERTRRFKAGGEQGAGGERSQLESSPASQTTGASAGTRAGDDMVRAPFGLSMHMGAGALHAQDMLYHLHDTAAEAEEEEMQHLVEPAFLLPPDEAAALERAEATVGPLGRDAHAADAVGLGHAMRQSSHTTAQPVAAEAGMNPPGAHLHHQPQQGASAFPGHGDISAETGPTEAHGHYDSSEHRGAAGGARRDASAGLAPPALLLSQVAHA